MKIFIIPGGDFNYVFLMKKSNKKRLRKATFFYITIYKL